MISITISLQFQASRQYNVHLILDSRVPQWSGDQEEEQSSKMSSKENFRVDKRCSYEPLAGAGRPVREVVPLLSEHQQDLAMKKSCSCEPGGVLCLLDPMTDYDWTSRPQGVQSDLTVSRDGLEWKVY